jgi:hypothetical protein
MKEEKRAIDVLVCFLSCTDFCTHIYPNTFTPVARSKIGCECLYDTVTGSAQEPIISM